jgi:hypothetical protein
MMRPTEATQILSETVSSRLLIDSSWLIAKIPMTACDYSTAAFDTTRAH